MRFKVPCSILGQMKTSEIPAEYVPVIENTKPEQLRQEIRGRERLMSSSFWVGMGALGIGFIAGISIMSEAPIVGAALAFAATTASLSATVGSIYLNGGRIFYARSKLDIIQNGAQIRLL